jgi:hypothetical protein
LRSRKYQVMFFKSAGSYAPHTPSPMRGSVLRFGGGLRLAADSAEHSASRVRAWPKSCGGAGETFPHLAEPGVIRRSMNATWYYAMEKIRSKSKGLAGRECMGWK